MSRIRSCRSAMAVAGGAALVVALAVPAPADAASPPKPAVSKIAPAYGPSGGGSRVTVTGKNFSKVKAVTFGGTAGSKVKVLSRSTLQVTAPRRKAGYADVRVKTSAGWSKVTRADRFRFVAAPTVRTLSVATGSTVGGGSITVTGSNFVAVRSVLFGTVKSTKVTVRSEGSLVARVPRGKAGVVHVRVVSAAGTSPAVAADRYAYRAWGAARFLMPSAGGITDLSCPTNDFCAAVDYHGAAVVRSNGTWSKPVLIDPPEAGNTYGNDLDAVSCVDATFCVAGGRSGVLFRWNGTAWTKTVSDVDGDIDSISCNSATNCFVISSDDSGGDEELWHFDGSTWTQDDTFGGESLGTVTCTVNVDCRLVHGDQLSRWDGTTWQDEAALPEDVYFRELTCPAATECVGVDEASSYHLSNGIWTGPTEVPTTETDGNARHIACTSPVHCYTDDGVTVFAYDGTSWSTITSPLPPDDLLCTATACSVSDGGSVAALDPGAPAGDQIDPLVGGISDVDCATSTACIAVGAGGRVATLRGTAWSTTGSDVTDALSSVSCPAANWCLAVGESGAAETYDGTAWHRITNVPAEIRTYGFQAVSCASTSYCVAMNGDIAWEYASGVWRSHRVTTTDHGTSHLDCTAPAFCAVFVANRFASVSNGTWSATKKVDVIDGQDVALACASPTMCIGVSNGSTAFRWNGKSWAKSATLLPYTNGYGWDVSCPSTSSCKVSTAGYNGANDYVASGVWSYDGGSWTLPQEKLAITPDHVSCAGASFCVATDSSGYLQTYR